MIILRVSWYFFDYSIWFESSILEIFEIFSILISSNIFCTTSHARCTKSLSQGLLPHLLFVPPHLLSDNSMLSCEENQKLDMTFNIFYKENSFILKSLISLVMFNIMEMFVMIWSWIRRWKGLITVETLKIHINKMSKYNRVILQLITGLGVKYI